MTVLAVFSVNDAEAASVTPDGLVRFKHTAEAAVLVRYLDQFASARLTYVRTDPNFVFKAPQPANYIDQHVFARQRELQLLPAPVASDEVFLRRVYLDVIGALPTPEEARAFLDSKDPAEAREVDRPPAGARRVRLLLGVEMGRRDARQSDDAERARRPQFPSLSGASRRRGPADGRSSPASC